MQRESATPAEPMASYPTTLGFLRHPEQASAPWHTPDGRSRFVRMVRQALGSMGAPLSAVDDVVWDDELNRSLLRASAQNFTIEQREVAVHEAAASMARTYMSRLAMGERLDALRERTAVAHVPRGEIEDERGRRGLSYATSASVPSARYQRYLDRVAHPPTRASAL